MKKVRNWKGWLVMGIGAVALSAATGFQLSRMFYEEAAYELLRDEGAFELRKYADRIVAETVVEVPERSTAASEGFRILAGYIFGKNTAAGGESTKVAMTTPVETEPASTKIAMTTPVEASTRGESGWRIAFTMPREYRMEDLPIPDDDRVMLRHVPGETVAALRFRGRATKQALQAHTDELLRAVSEAGLTPAGPVSFAFYDPPWVLPWFRRTEVLVRVAPEDGAPADMG